VVAEQYGSPVAGARAKTQRVGLATTSTGDDDVALTAQNTADGNLIHAASRVTGWLSPYDDELFRSTQGKPYIS
jgi:hypothetical protein